MHSIKTVQDCLSSFNGCLLKSCNMHQFSSTCILRNSYFVNLYEFIVAAYAPSADIVTFPAFIYARLSQVSCSAKIYEIMLEAGGMERRAGQNCDRCCWLSRCSSRPISVRIWWPNKAASDTGCRLDVVLINMKLTWYEHAKEMPNEARALHSPLPYLRRILSHLTLS